MMNKKLWSTLFSVQILDTTKKASDAWDVALVPTDECVLKLKRYKMFFKKLKNGGVVIFENDGQRKPIATEKAECFTFYLKLLNSALGSNLDVNRDTSGTVFLATLILYFFGGAGINDFAFTFLVGIVTGTYSSIYIASALVLWWHKGARPHIGSPINPALSVVDPTVLKEA